LISLEYVDLSFLGLDPQAERKCMLKFNLKKVCWFLFRQVSLKVQTDLNLMEPIVRSLEAQYGHCYHAFLKYLWLLLRPAMSHSSHFLSTNADIFSQIPLDPLIKRSLYFHLQV
jgi:hypothetical protein